MTQLCLLLQAPRLDRTAALRVAKTQGDQAIAAGAEKASSVDPVFIDNACAHIEQYLKDHGKSSGELLVDSCKLAGIVPLDDRHFGVCFRRLLKAGVIEWAGEARRSRGHGSRGGSLYRLKGGSHA